MYTRYQARHYEDIARLINDSWPEAVPEDVNEVILFSLANKFADLFTEDNPDFNKDNFLADCGLKGR